VVFVPEGKSSLEAIESIAAATLSALLAQATPSPQSSAEPDPPEVTVVPLPSATPEPSPTPTLLPTPIPAQVSLTGIVHEYQQFNNCGPANLAMALTYWGWQGDQRQTRAYLRPNLEVDDKNVNPSEMVAFVEAQAGLRALARVGGDLDLLKRLIAAGFPVVIEEGHDPADDWWMGHYLLFSGYDDAQGRFITQDSLLGPDLPRSYEDLSAHWWRDFNNVYVVVYPVEREAEVLAVLGPQADPAYNYQHAAQKALAEIPKLTGRDLFFAWFSLGSSRVGQGDYAGAAEAYDQAFALYQSLPEEERPYRLMWYQDGPYAAYYYTERFQDVVNLANTTFAWVGKPVLEESYYWRGLAYASLGNFDQALSDLKKAIALNPNYAAPRQALSSLGYTAP